MSSTKIMEPNKFPGDQASQDSHDYHRRFKATFISILPSFTIIYIRFPVNIVKLKHASSCVLSVDLPQRMQNHIGCICLFFSPLCVFKCLLKFPAREDAKLHWLYLFNFSPLCVIKCVLKLPASDDA